MAIVCATVDIVDNFDQLVMFFGAIVDNDEVRKTS